MTLLDDARRLLDDRPPRGGSSLKSHPRGRCYYCLGDYDQREPHEPDCPWLSLPRIVAALEATGALLDAVQRIQGHHERTGEKVGGGTFSYCSDRDDEWPCDVAKLREPADALWKLLDPDAYREHELLRAYLGYMEETQERGIHITEEGRQRPGESRTEWFTRLLTKVGRKPA